MKKNFFILLLFLISANTFSQNVLDVHEINKQYNYFDTFLEGYALYYEDYDNHTNPPEILHKDFTSIPQKYFQQFNSNTIWIKTTLLNSSNEKRYPLLFYFLAFEQVDYFVYTNENYTKISSNEKGRLDFNLAPLEEKTFLIRLHNANHQIGKINAKLWYPNLYDTEELRTTSSKFSRYKIRALISNIFSGFFLILFLYHLMIFFQSKQSVYLYYCIYVLSLLLYFFPQNNLFAHLLDFHDSFNVHYAAYNILIQPVIYFCYFQFGRAFLAKSKPYTQFRKYLNIFSFISILAMLILVFEYYVLKTGFFFQAFNYFRIFIICCCIFLLVYFIRNYSPIVKFIFWGASFFLLGGLVALVTSVLGSMDNSSFVPIDFMRLGSTIEILIFALGLGYQVKQTEQEKVETQNLLIEELQENERLQTQLQDQLQQELSTAQQEKQIAQLELQLLRTRMNPHFVFNSLNALKRFVLENKTAAASKYLHHFSTLLRQILINSSKKQITLKEEISTLTNYLQLEKNRLNEHFDFHFHIDDSIDTEYTMIPPMLLQPYVENAIWHGVRHLENKKGIIEISFKQASEKVLISIEDNGIGRSKSEVMNQKIRPDHQSQASQIIENQLQLFQIYDDLLLDINIIDKPNHTGTIVEILIKE